MKADQPEIPGQSQNAPCGNAREARRVISIAGPVAKRFSEICRALNLKQQEVATEQLDHWNRKNEPRAKKALATAAASMG